MQCKFYHVTQILGYLAKPEHFKISTSVFPHTEMSLFVILLYISKMLSKI